MSLRSSIGAIRRDLLSSAHSRLAPLNDSGPIVTFTFDDFPRSALLTGGAILERWNVRGTYYTAPGLMNTSSDAGDLFRQSDVETLCEQGHELASHTFSHISARKTEGGVFENDLLKGRNAIEQLCGYDSGNFAYPFGDVTFRTKKRLGPQLTSARGIFPGLNGPNTDLNLLRANSLYGDLDQLPAAEKMIQQNLKQKTWLIFYTHDVQAKPSSFGCTPELLEAVVSSAVRHGCRILTIQETLECIGVSKGHTSRRAARSVPA